MRYRKLRIAWSVGCGLLAVLLIVLWIRSYWVGDFIRFPASETSVNVFSVRRTFSISVTPGPVNPPRNWEWESQLVSRMMPVIGPGRSWAYRSDADGKYLVFPHRILTLIFAMLAICGAAPWLRWRFSLRTLLIATTLVAIILGLVVYAAS